MPEEQSGNRECAQALSEFREVTAQARTQVQSSDTPLDPQALAAYKRQQRKAARRWRGALLSEERATLDHQIAEHVKAQPCYEQASVVFGYYSFGDEVATHALLQEALEMGKTVVLPRCVGPRHLDWYRVDSFEGLELSSMGVAEPPARADHQLTKDQWPQSGAVALIPALAFDRAGKRLGYGGGYYDGFLAEFPGVSLGLGRRAMVVDALGALEPHDASVDFIVTEAGVIIPQG